MQFCPSQLTTQLASRPRVPLSSIRSFPSLCWRRIPALLVNLSQRSPVPPPTPHPPPPAPPRLCPEHQSVCQNTDSASPCSESIGSHLYPKQSPRFILPITSKHLLFKFQIIFLGLTVSLLFLEFTHYFSKLSHLIYMLLESYIYTHLHTHKCASLHTQVHVQTYD